MARKTPSRRRRKRKLILFIVEIIVLALVVAALYYYHKLDKIDIRKVDETKIDVNDITEETAETLHGYKTIALFGLDNRDQGTLSRGNTDTIMVVAINNDTKEVSMVSVYRDTYLNVAAADEEQKFRKANSAYAYGGAEQAITMLNRNLDLDIDNYVTVDFNAVVEAIDILGGIEIDVESEKELEWLNAYIDDVNFYLETDAGHLDSLGTQTVNGVQALSYARIRYTAGNDFKRAERQRRVLSEMVNKAKSANLSQINELIDAVFPDIQTDLSKKDIITLATALLGYDMSNSGGFPYDRTTDTPSKAIGSIVIPCDLESNVIKLHQQLYGNEAYEPSQTVLDYNEYIIDVTGKTTESAETDEFSDRDDFTGDGTSDSGDGSTSDGADSDSAE